MKLISRAQTDFAANSEVLYVKADNIDQVFRITVTGASAKLASSDLSHGIIALDGDLMSTIAPGIVNALSMGAVVPNHVVVTIGYPLDSEILWNNLRVRDLTPVQNKNWSYLQSKWTANKCPDGGGAKAFLAFINDELKPFVETEFGVDKHEWTLTGGSFGGLFSTFALITDANGFQRYNIINPSVWYASPFMRDLAKDFAVCGEPVYTSAIFIAGAMETREQQAHHFLNLPKEDLELMGSIPDMILDMMEIAALLRNREGLRINTLSMPGEDHFSVVAPALTQGMRWLYSKPPA